MTSKEIVTNNPLSGAELKKIIRESFEKLLENEGFLSDNLAYGRVAYFIGLRMHIDNYLTPTTESYIDSRPIDKNRRLIDPSLEALENFPLKDPSDAAVLGATELQHIIESPNLSRIQHELPVPVLTTQLDGSKVYQTIKYPKTGEEGEPNIEITDKTREVRAAMGLPNAPVPLSETVPAADPRHYAGHTLCKCGYKKDDHALSGLLGVGIPPKDGFPLCEGFTPHDMPNRQPEVWPVTPT